MEGRKRSASVDRGRRLPSGYISNYYRGRSEKREREREEERERKRRVIFNNVHMRQTLLHAANVVQPEICTAMHTCKAEHAYTQITFVAT